jgi:hypothetical protein
MSTITQDDVAAYEEVTKALGKAEEALSDLIDREHRKERKDKVRRLLIARDKLEAALLEVRQQLS